MLLRPFAVEWVTPAHAGGLAALAARYGESWHRNLLEAWFGSRNTWRYTGDVDRNGWAGALPGLTAALRDAGAATTAGWLLAASWGWLDADIRLWLGYSSPATRRKQLAELGKPLAGLLAAAGGTALAGAIVAALREHGDDMLGCLLPMLRAAGPGPSAPLEELARDCERRLTAITERPARADDDWSVPWSGGCGCELCGTLGGFLADRREPTLPQVIGTVGQRGGGQAGAEGGLAGGVPDVVVDRLAEHAAAGAAEQLSVRRGPERVQVLAEHADQDGAGWGRRGWCRRGGA